MLLKNLYQASRNKVIDIEHIVFDSCRLNGVQSVTHVAIKEQGEAWAKAAHWCAGSPPCGNGPTFCTPVR